jgi:hypothetical protein
MNPELLDLDLPTGPLPDLSERLMSPEEIEAWQTENRRLRLLRGDANVGPGPVDVPFVIEE